MKIDQHLIFIQGLLSQHDGDIPRSSIVSYLEEIDKSNNNNTINCFWCSRELAFAWPKAEPFHLVRCSHCQKESTAYFGTVKAKRFSTFKERFTYSTYLTHGKYHLRTHDPSGEERLIEIQSFSSKNSIEVRAKDKIVILANPKDEIENNLKVRGKDYPPRGLVVIHNSTINNSFEITLVNQKNSFHGLLLENSPSVLAVRKNG